MKKYLALVLVVVFLSGCFGGFKLTRKVYDFNKNVGGKWVNELVFLGLNIVPIYSIASFCDVVILNTIEFWTGKNPIAQVPGKDTIALDNMNKRVVISSKESDKVRIDIFDSFKPQSSFVLEKHSDCVIAKDTTGKLLFKAITNEDGSISMFDAKGKLVKTCSADEAGRLY
ncbi:MAG: DUF3332 family protein [Elusimicrobia bacterium]|nr:DUF3332 family protein [Elusimicrobiota bacterium]